VVRTAETSVVTIAHDQGVAILEPGLKDRLAGWTTFASPLLPAFASRWWAVLLMLLGFLVMSTMTFAYGYRLAKLLGTKDIGSESYVITVKGLPYPGVNITVGTLPNPEQLSSYNNEDAGSRT
jgi:hypothetical protein